MWKEVLVIQSFYLFPYWYFLLPHPFNVSLSSLLPWSSPSLSGFFELVSIMIEASYPTAGLVTEM
jgi:hypothetical protein